MAQACYVKEQKKIYVFGGVCDSKKIEKSIEAYDVDKNEWELIEVKNWRSYIPK
jgi:N-acetylneuraminic acid mutarotase